MLQFDQHHLTLKDILHLPLKHEPPFIDKNVHVWQFPLNIALMPISWFEQFLSIGENQRAQRFLKQADKNQFVIAHSLMRIVLSQYLHCTPQDIQLGRGYYGKPKLMHSTVQFSLSHSHEYGLLALTPQHPLGIDVEFHRPIHHLAGLSKKVLNPAEQIHILQLEKNAQFKQFMQLWARKEALAKGLGLGLAMPFATVNVLDIAQVTLNEERLFMNHPKLWWLYDLPNLQHYSAALALPFAISHITWYSLTDK